MEANKQIKLKNAQKQTKETQRYVIQITDHKAIQ